MPPLTQPQLYFTVHFKIDWWWPIRSSMDCMCTKHMNMLIFVIINAKEGNSMPHYSKKTKQWRVYIGCFTTQLQFTTVNGDSWLIDILKCHCAGLLLWQWQETQRRWRDFLWGFQRRCVLAPASPSQASATICTGRAGRPWINLMSVVCIMNITLHYFIFCNFILFCFFILSKP